MLSGTLQLDETTIGACRSFAVIVRRCRVLRERQIFLQISQSAEFH